MGKPGGDGAKVVVAGVGELTGKLFVAASVLALAITTEAVAGEDNAPAADALAADAATIAAETGWSSDYALKRLRNQERFGLLLEDLAAEYPATYAGGYTSNGTVALSRVLFKGEVPSAAIDAAARRNVDTDFGGGAKYSLVELEKIATGVHADLTNAGFKAGTGFSIEHQRVEVSVARPAGLDQAEDQWLLSTLPDSTKSSEVQVGFVDDPIDIPAHTYGGDKLLDDGSFECTSGFVVADGSTWGVSSAGHCSGINQYKQADGLVYSVTFQDQDQGEWGDFEWYTTPHPEYAKFYAIPTDLRDLQAVKGSGAFAVGDWQCGFGRATNDKVCSAVQYTSFSCAGLGRQVVMTVADATGYMHLGDSGGPWFLGSTGAGIFHGWCVLPQDNLAHLMFSKAAHMFSAIGAAPVINPP